MADNDQCKEAFACKDKALELSNEIENFTNKAKSLVERSEELAKCTENISKHVCLEDISIISNNFGTFETKEEAKPKEPEKNTNGASKIDLAVFEEVPKAETSVDKVATVGIASTILGMFPNKSADIENTSVCMDEKCRTLSKTIAKLLSSGKENVVQNEDVAKNLKLSAEGLVGSLDITIENSQKAHDVLNKAIDLAERLAKGECSEEDLKGLDLQSDESLVTDIIIPTTKQYMASVADKFQVAATSVKEQLDALAHDVRLQNSGIFCAGIALGMVSGYLIGHVSKKQKWDEYIKKAWSNNFNRNAAKQENESE